jgi:hypothetical protein
MQTTMFSTGDVDIARAPSAYLDDPTAIIVSVSGGLDSSAAAIWARRRWPDRPMILWHAYLADMDWPQTDAQIGGLAATLGNCHQVSVQAVYTLNGKITPSGANGTHFERIHVVRDGEHWYGPAAGDPDEITTLLDLAMRARNGQPPTKRIRYCTDYLKIRLCDRWLREQAPVLGVRPLLLSGERHAESAGRATLPSFQWRFSTCGWDVLWLRPVVELRLHEITRMSLETGVPIHPGYALQGETIASLLDPERDERGRARLSCVCCIFTQPRHLATTIQQAPELVRPYVQRVQAYEQASGYSWQQRGALNLTSSDGDGDREPSPMESGC